jgi:hypothetical protein
MSVLGTANHELRWVASFDQPVWTFRGRARRTASADAFHGAIRWFAKTAVNHGATPECGYVFLMLPQWRTNIASPVPAPTAPAETSKTAVLRTL